MVAAVCESLQLLMFAMAAGHGQDSHGQVAIVCGSVQTVLIDLISSTVPGSWLTEWCV